MSIGHRRGSDLALLWLWCRPAAAALIQSLAWEPPYDAGVALKKKRTVTSSSAGPSHPGCEEWSLGPCLLVSWGLTWHRALAQT